jgi:F420-non-reducing hydrogenase large subunit
MLTRVNLIVATNHNAAPIAMSVEKAAKNSIKGGKVDDGLLNMVEMAFRAYDPCHACATHTLPGRMPLEARIHDHEGRLIHILRKDAL